MPIFPGFFWPGDDSKPRTCRAEEFGRGGVSRVRSRNQPGGAAERPFVADNATKKNNRKKNINSEVVGEVSWGCRGGGKKGKTYLLFKSVWRKELNSIGGEAGKRTKECGKPRRP